MQGQYEAGEQEGIWTSWDRDGKLTEQCRYHHDEPGETRTAPPWLTEVSDQQ
jgi:antitoxin component YwqK of YwqJK toxin-antitoxin module